MSKVINMSDYVTVGQDIRPKMESRAYEGHRYILRFDPNADASDRWHWTVKFTQTYEYHGAAASIEAATKAAKKRIRDLVRSEHG